MLKGGLMEIIPKKSYPMNLTVLTIQRIKELAKIYNCNDEWVVECLINEFYKNEKERQETGSQGVEKEGQ